MCIHTYIYMIAWRHTHIHSVVRQTLNWQQEDLTVELQLSLFCYFHTFENVEDLAKEKKIDTQKPDGVFLFSSDEQGQTIKTADRTDTGSHNNSDRNNCGYPTWWLNSFIEFFHNYVIEILSWWIVPWDLKKNPNKNPGFWMQTFLCNTVINYLQDNLWFNNKGLWY